MAKGVNRYDGSQWVEVATVEDGSGTERPVKRWDGSQWVQIYPTSAIPDSENLQAHYDATALSLSDGQPVSTWGDETGSGYDLTAGSAPTFKTNIINGNPVVRFSDDMLDVNWNNLSQPNHVFIVASANETPGSWSYIYDSPDSSNRHFFAITGSQNWGMGVSNGIQDGSSDQNNHIFSLLYDGASSAMRIDGSNELTDDAGSGNMGGLRLCRDRDNSSALNADIGEILVYPQDKSGIQSDVESYLSGKWGISI